MIAGNRKDFRADGGAEEAGEGAGEAAGNQCGDGHRDKEAAAAPERVEIGEE